MRHHIAPLSSGPAFVAASFEVTAPITTGGLPIKHVSVQFFDASGKAIPHGGIPMAKGVGAKEIAAAIAALASTPAAAGETMAEVLTRAAVTYVTALYGVTVTV